VKIVMVNGTDSVSDCTDIAKLGVDEFSFPQSGAIVESSGNAGLR